MGRLGEARLNTTPPATMHGLSPIECSATKLVTVLCASLLQRVSFSDSQGSAGATWRHVVSSHCYPMHQVMTVNLLSNQRMHGSIDPASGDANLQSPPYESPKASPSPATRNVKSVRTSFRRHFRRSTSKMTESRVDCRCEVRLL